MDVPAIDFQVMEGSVARADSMGQKSDYGKSEIEPDRGEELPFATALLEIGAIYRDASVAAVDGERQTENGERQPSEDRQRDPGGMYGEQGQYTFRIAWGRGGR
jgi:hypothetical protein